MTHRIGCLVMAAGNAVRFGRNKLTASLDGKALIERTLSLIDRECFAKVTVVTQYAEIEDLAAKHGFACLYNDRPHEGISRTIRIGTQAMADCDAILYLVADQPLLQKASVQALVDTWRRNPTRIVGAASGDRRGNPNIFPACFFAELSALEGERGGKSVIHAHADAYLPVELPERELFDCDTPQDLASIQKNPTA